LADVRLSDGPLLFRGLFHDLTDIRIAKDHGPFGWYQDGLPVTAELHAGRRSKIVREADSPGN
jgi:hypothetical protein